MVDERLLGAVLEGHSLLALASRHLAEVVVVGVLYNADLEVAYKEAMLVVAVWQTAF
jgi:hypothetical protein